MSAELLINRNAAGPRSMNAEERAVLPVEMLADAATAIRCWPEYAPTPLHRLHALAKELEIAEVAFKDEGDRFGLGSFKALGGAYAVERLAAEGASTVATATDGNHGRAVAWGAKRAGCHAIVYVHATVSEARAEAIRSYGATVVRTSGNYDDAVRRAADDASANGWTIVSDTAWDGYTDIPRLVMAGYGVMVDEALDGLDQPPTHVFVQAGVGAVAAAVCAVQWHRFEDRRARLIVVEPERAACLYASAQAGRRVNATGDIETLMAGLACGEASPLAWQLLKCGADAFMTVPDSDVAPAMRRLARPSGGDPPVVAGESAVAGLCALRRACQDATWRQALGLDARSRVVLFGTEGATDRALYDRLVETGTAT